MVRTHCEITHVDDVCHGGRETRDDRLELLHELMRISDEGYHESDGEQRGAVGRGLVASRWIDTRHGTIYSTEVLKIERSDCV